MAQENERRIAVFLDFENLVTNTGITAASFDLKPSIDRLLEKGKVIYRRAYADWSRFRDAKGPLHELGVELMEVPPSTRTGKNGADMRLVIDALELCHARDYIDTFVIASGDSDFCPLAYKLRENDRHVIGIGVKESTSRLFVKACDEFVYLKPPAEGEAPARKPRRGRKAAGSVDGTASRSTRAAKSAKAATKAEDAPAQQPEAGPAEEEPAVPAEKAAPAKRTRKRGAKKTVAVKEGEAAAANAAPAAKTAPAAKPAPRVPALAREVVSSLLARATGPINPSLIKETIVRKQPDFDERDHGFSTFSKLLEAMELEGLLKRQQIRGRQWYVVPPDSVPPPAPVVQAALPFRAEPGADDGDYQAAPAAPEAPGDDEVPF